MDDPERAPVRVDGLMRRVQALQRVAEDGDRDVRRHALALLGAELEELSERHALDVFHHDAQVRALEHDVQGGNDVRVPNTCREPGLVGEHAREVGIARQMRVHPLDGDGPREADRTAHLPEVHLRHAAGRDEPAERVPPDLARRRIAQHRGHDARIAGRAALDDATADRSVTP